MSRPRDGGKEQDRAPNVLSWNLAAMYFSIYLMLQFIPLFSDFLLTGRLFSASEIPGILAANPRFSIISAVWIVLLIMIPPGGRSFGHANLDRIYFNHSASFILWMAAPVLATLYWLALYSLLAWSLLDIDHLFSILLSQANPWLAGAAFVNVFWIVFSVRFTEPGAGGAMDPKTFLFVTSQIILSIFVLLFGYIAYSNPYLEPSEYLKNIFLQGRYLHFLTLSVLFLCISYGLTPRRIVMRMQE